MKRKACIVVLISILILFFCMFCGSVDITLPQLFAIFKHKFGGAELPSDVSPIMESILFSIRVPRALTAFFTGAALSVSGVIMQSVLQNPLASSYTLGVSSGASLGAALVISAGLSSAFLLPAAGFLFGLATVAAALLLSSKIDRSVSNTTVILIGVIISLFASGILNLLSSIDSEHAKQIWMWMTGSFSAKNYTNAAFCAVFCILGTIGAMLYSKHLDILTFGDLQSQAMGVSVKHTKTVLILIATLMTGVCVSFTGVIGFVDLAAPHIVRRVFGSKHKIVLPMSAFTGGAFMALCDYISRTVVSPSEIPVGAVTAILGAPFFAYIFFRNRGRG